MQPLTQAQIESIVADANNPAGLLASYQEIANKTYEPLINAMTSASHEKWTALRGQVPQHTLAQIEVDEDIARLAYTTDLNNASFICGLLLGGSNFSELLVERLQQKDGPTPSQELTSETQVENKGDGRER